jgi:hypothetical protein
LDSVEYGQKLIGSRLKSRKEDEMVKLLAYPEEPEVIAFLKEAQLNGWPAGVHPASAPELHEFKQVRFVRDQWQYLDLFCGYTTDVGFEVVFYEGRLIWGLAYRGGVVGGTSGLGPDEIVTFLIEARIACGGTRGTYAIPQGVSGTYESSDGRWRYRHIFSGEFKSFVAVEEIVIDGELCYERTHVGGYCGDDSLYGPPLPLLRSHFDRALHFVSANTDVSRFTAR